MTAITSTGLGSGLDVESIITKLMAAESKPLTLLQNQETGLKTKLSSYGQVKSLFADLQTASQSLTSVSLWNKTTATSSDSAVLNASTGASAATGSYAVTVANLAGSQTVTSAAQASASSDLSAGTLTIETGTWVGDPPTSFAPKSSGSVVINIDSPNTSLSAIRDKINAANAGVTATIITDANGARLSIRSNSTGAENGFRLTATEAADDGNAATGLSALNYDATDSASPMSLSEAAKNANATVNGINISSASNTITGAIDGVTLNLTKASASPVTVTVAPDSAAVRSGIDGFVKAFNALAKYLHDQTQYDASAKKGQPLQGDRTAISLQTQLRNMLNTPSSASSTFATLNDVGISMQADGTLSTSASKLDTAMNKLPELRKVLAATGTTNDDSGFISRYSSLASKVLGTDGAIQTANAGVQSQVNDLDKRQAQINDRLTATEARLRAQYQALDTKMSSLTALSTYITQQFSSNNNSNKG